MNSKAAILLFILMSGTVMVGVWGYTFTQVEESFWLQQQAKVEMLGSVFACLVLEFSLGAQNISGEAPAWQQGVDFFPDDYLRSEDDSFFGRFRYATAYTRHDILAKTVARTLKIATRDTFIRGVYVIDRKGFIPWSNGSFADCNIKSGAFIPGLAQRIKEGGLKTESDTVAVYSQLNSVGRQWGWIVIECDMKAAKEIKHKALNLALSVIMIIGTILLLVSPYIKKYVIKKVDNG